MCISPAPGAAAAPQWPAHAFFVSAQGCVHDCGSSVSTASAAAQLCVCEPECCDPVATCSCAGPDVQAAAGGRRQGVCARLPLHRRAKGEASAHERHLPAPRPRGAHQGLLPTHPEPHRQLLRQLQGRLHHGRHSNLRGCASPPPGLESPALLYSLQLKKGGLEWSGGRRHVRPLLFWSQVLSEHARLTSAALDFVWLCLWPLSPAWHNQSPSHVPAAASCRCCASSRWWCSSAAAQQAIPSRALTASTREVSGQAWPIHPRGGLPGGTVTITVPVERAQGETHHGCIHGRATPGCCSVALAMVPCLFDVIHRRMPSACTSCQTPLAGRCGLPSAYPQRARVGCSLSPFWPISGFTRSSGEDAAVAGCAVVDGVYIRDLSAHRVLRPVP